LTRKVTLRSRSAAAAKRIHLVYPHGARVSAPDSIGRHLGTRLAKMYEVVYHDWDERGVLQPEPGDVLLGHAHPEPGTIFRRSARQPGWTRVLMLGPYHHGDLRHVAFVDSIIPDCDLFLAITGPYWFNSVAHSSCSHWHPKMVHMDMAVDRNDFPPLKQGFGERGRRRFVYIGNTAHMKNTPYLTQISRRMQGVEFSWIGPGTTDIPGFVRLGFLDFKDAGARATLSGFDFLLTVGDADANPTTILEAMAWGIVPVCTPQSGYVGIPSITNVPLDDADAAAAMLARLNELPGEALLDLQAANWRLLDAHYNWERFANQVIAAVESSWSPPLGRESLGRRILFAGYAQLSPYRPLGAALGRVRKLGRTLSRNLASAAWRMTGLAGWHTPDGRHRTLRRCMGSMTLGRFTPAIFRAVCRPSKFAPGSPPRNRDVMGCESNPAESLQAVR
jgi:hypothetical protein